MDLSVPPVFSNNEVKFKDFPLFSLTNHVKHLLGNNLDSFQVISNMKAFVSWLVSYWEDDVEITQYPDISSPGDRDAQDEVTHLLSVKEQIFEDFS